MYVTYALRRRFSLHVAPNSKRLDHFCRANQFNVIADSKQAHNKRIGADDDMISRPGTQNDDDDSRGRQTRKSKQPPSHANALILESIQSTYTNAFAFNSTWQ